jgi:hypothetical protein
MTTLPLPHSTVGVVVVSVGLAEVVVDVEVAEDEVVLLGLGLEVVVSPPPLIQPLATTLRNRTPTRRRAKMLFLISITWFGYLHSSIIVSDIYTLRFWVHV